MTGQLAALTMTHHNRGGSMADTNLDIINLHPDKQCRAYLIADRARGEAALLDPRFDVAPQYLERLKTEGLRLRYAIDTHTHADHLSGSDRLRNLTGCRVVMSSHTKSHVPDLKLADDATLELGASGLRLLHTPGHTPDSMCLVADNTVLTGDTLFIGGSARTDFMGGSPSALFDSFRRLEALGRDMRVLPGHDYNNKTATTIGQELLHNPAFAERDKQTLVARLSVKGDLPLNMREILAFNVDAGIAERAIISAKDHALEGDAASRFTIVDVRTDFERDAAFIPGSIHIPLPDFAARLGELKDKRRPLLMVCKSGVRATLAFMAARLGGEREILLLEGGMDAWAAAGRPMSAGHGRAPEVVSMPQTGPSQACAAGGGGCAAQAAPAAIPALATPEHSWSDWVI